MEYLTHDRCLISGSKELRPLRGYEKHYLVRSVVGFVFCSRIPTEDELRNNYEGYNREDHLSPITVKRYHALLDQFEKYRKNNRILDVGCGVGQFLVEAKKRGWEVYGTEYTDDAVKRCRINGINMHIGKLDPDWFEDGFFDVVTSFEVLEHINNPVEEVQNIRKILAPGGLFYFTTPNFNAIERYVLKADYKNVIVYPEHLCYYTKKTAHYLMSKNGFVKTKMTTTGICITRIRAGIFPGSAKQGSETTSNRDDNLRNILEENRLAGIAKRITNGVLNLLGVGDALKGWYEKI